MIEAAKPPEKGEAIMKKFGYALVSLTLILCMALSGALAADVTVFPRKTACTVM